MSLSANEQKPSSKYRVPALEKGLAILEALAYSPVPLSLTQLAQNLGRSSNEIYRMLTFLERRDYIIKEEHSGNYMLSLKLHELTQLRPPIKHLLNVADKPMEDLARELRESCHLSILQNRRLLVVKEALSPTRVRLSVRVGGLHPIIYTVSGRLLLASLPPNELSIYLEPDEDYQLLTPAERDAFEANLATIRKAEYTTAQDETHSGVTDIGILVGNSNVGLAAALTIAYLTNVRKPSDKKDMLKALRECAQKITKAMGGHHEI